MSLNINKNRQKKLYKQKSHKSGLELCTWNMWSC